MEAVRRRGHRAGAGGLGALGGLPGDRRRRSRIHRAHRADGLGRAVPHLEPGAAGARHARAGAVPPQLVDGAQDHHRLGHPDEQGAGADRGLSPVPGRAGPARGGGASPVDHPCAGGFRDGSMLAQLASPDMRTPDRARPGLAGAHGRADQAHRPGGAGTAELRAARRGPLPALGLARQAMQRAAWRPPCSTRPTRWRSRPS